MPTAATEVRRTLNDRVDAIIAEYNKVRKDFLRLNSGAVFHADARSLITTANATSEATAVALANAFKAAHNADCASAVDETTGEGHHLAADATNLITSPAAIDEASAITLANEAYGDHNAHVVNLAAHAGTEAAATATNQTATTGATVATGTTGATVATGTTGATVGNANTRRLASFSLALAAPGVPMHAQDAGGGALDLVAGWTNPLPRRGMTITRSAAGPASVDYTVYMTTPDGGSVNQVVSVGSGAAASTTFAGEVTRVTTTVDPVSTTDFATAAPFCVGALFTGTPTISCNGVAEALVASDAGAGSVTATTATNGAKEFCVAFNEAHGHTVTDAGHTHTVTDAGHTHTLTDAGHTHTQDAHNHASSSSHLASSATATDAATLYTRLNDLKAKRNIHVAAALNCAALEIIDP
jgi:hypothetical protein